MTPAGPTSTAQELIQGIDLRGKTAVVTGAAGGIGLEVARSLASAGAELVLPVRELERGSDLAERLIFDSGNMKIRSLQMDLMDFDSVRRFAHCVSDEYASVDILINCAGVMACPLRRSQEGFEAHFAINYLGHFLLTCSLADRLAQSEGCRVVNLSSVGHHLSPVVFEDLHFERRDYDKWLAYGQSKTANALFALALNEQLEAINGRAFSVHPGVIMTNLQCHLSRTELERLGWISDKGSKAAKSPAQGAATVIWAALSDEAYPFGGAYCEDCQIAEIAQPEVSHRGVRRYAQDREAAQRLWTLSEHMVDARLTLSVAAPSRRVVAL